MALSEGPSLIESMSKEAQSMSTSERTLRMLGRLNSDTSLGVSHLDPTYDQG